MITPPFLEPGDSIAVVAPSYGIQDSIAMMICRNIKKAGFEPVMGKHLFSSPDRFAASPAERAEDFNNMVRRDGIKAIICARGGYGVIQTLPGIDMKAVRRNPKWVVGYSDFTAMNMLYTKAGVMSLHANMGRNLYYEEIGADDFNAKNNEAMYAVLRGNIPQYTLPSHPFNVEGKAEARLFGGNFITFLTLLESDYDCLKKGKWILFIEECDETFHAVDRLFNSLLYKDCFKNIEGIIFGEFVNCKADIGFDSIEEILNTYTSKLNIPVCYGFPASHGESNLPLIEGAKITLDVGKDSTKISFNLLP